jgi:hypothetical protein
MKGAPPGLNCSLLMFQWKESPITKTNNYQTRRKKKSVGTKDTCSLTDLEKNLICSLGYVTIGQIGGKINLDTSLHSDFGGEDNLDIYLAT